MPIEYFYSEPENVLCVKVNVPVVLADTEIQFIVDNVATLPELAQKVDHIDAMLKEFDARPIFIHENGDRWISVIEEEGWDRFGWRWSEHRQPVVKKILVSGTLHKQIFYVDKNDVVKHVGEDIPFADHVTLDVPQPVVNENNVYVKIHHKKIDMRWDLRRGSRLQQTGVMIFEIKVVEDRQVFVNVCPQLDKKCVKGVNLLKDGNLESWATDTTPVFWGASNVIREGTAGAELGNVANRAASLFQTVNEGIVPTGTYRLCFDVTDEAATGAGQSAYTLTAELVFYDRAGRVVTSESQSWTASQLPDNTRTRYCINAMAPEEAKSALVRFNFDPNTAVNTAQVLIGNVMLECTRVQNEYYEKYYTG
ncbi:cupin domain-containing protein [Desulfotruncus alcoholivorax]|uniref:SPOCS domain-containing protein n=1 Tax=Desulfotruncus alcoholivorax TaxID=265477 RepID=UPI0004276EF4|nr:SPOCS domain-containing protein [Desulfotruncus alcoholivorax]